MSGSSGRSTAGGNGIGGDWALAAPMLRKSVGRRPAQDGRRVLQTGTPGFVLADALISRSGHFGWRAMFLCGLARLILSLYIVFRGQGAGELAGRQGRHRGCAITPLGDFFPAPTGAARFKRPF